LFSSHQRIGDKIVNVPANGPEKEGQVEALRTHVVNDRMNTFNKNIFVILECIAQILIM